MIKIEFPANRTDIAIAVAAMLNTIGGAPADSPMVTNVKKAELRDSLAIMSGKEGTLDEQAVADLESGDPADNAQDEYQQTAIDALLGEDEAAEFTADQVGLYGDNLRFAFNNRGSDLVSLSVVAEVLVDLGGVAQTLADTGLLVTALLQSAGTTEPPAKVDVNGVPFCDKHCATAADPFYGSGKMKGQWKKKRGVDQPTYDAWYADQLEPSGQTHSEDTPIDTGAAFGGQSTQAPVADAPKNLGELMMWVSAQQTAGNITQDKVQAAYVTVGVSDVSQLFTASPDAQAVYIASIYQVLTA